MQTPKPDLKIFLEQTQVNKSSVACYSFICQSFRKRVAPKEVVNICMRRGIYNVK